jgi:hypothetical protein
MQDLIDAYHPDYDALSESDMLDLLYSLGDTQYETNAFGVDIASPSYHYWLRDLIKVNKCLKAMARKPDFLDSERLIQPVFFGSDMMRLGSDPLLNMLQTVYTVIVTIFDPHEPMPYRPSPYAESFLWAFQQCAYLHQAGFNEPPTMTRGGAEQAVMDLNNRLGAWYEYMAHPSFVNQCGRNKRNTRDNYKRITHLIGSLFDCHSCLQVLRLDLSYSKADSPWITYETARDHREQLCGLFNTHGLFAHLLGFAWKLEWRPRKGFHYHFLFFFNGHKVQKDVMLASQIGQLWAQQITGGQGSYYNCNRNAENKYKINTCGEIVYNDIHKRKGLNKTAGYLTKCDEYASMAALGRTFQTSPAPQVPKGPHAGRPRQQPPSLPDFQPESI